MISIAWFVSAHGFGHAARASAMMNAVNAHTPEVRFEILTEVPEWFFRDSVSADYAVHREQTDVGLVQRTAMDEDLEATIVALNRWLPLDPVRVTRLSEHIQRLGCQAVVADISPLGLIVARSAGVPGFLVENFTWDMIYSAYGARDERFSTFAAAFADLFATADLRIQTEPWCKDEPGTLKVSPVFREPRVGRSRVRSELGVEKGEKLIVVSMGGIPWDFGKITPSLRSNDAIVVIPGGAAMEVREDSVILLPHRSRFYHPDLLGAADAVIGKLGYSTLAEVWSAGCRMGWIKRPTFPESAPLAEWAGSHLQGLEIGNSELLDGTWIEEIPRLLRLEKAARPQTNGANQAAAAILDFI